MNFSNQFKPLALALLCAAGFDAQAAQRLYPTPEAAGKAFIAAARNPSPATLAPVLGDDYRELGSGDKTVDREDLRKIAKDSLRGSRIYRAADDRATLLIGADDWPLPIPIVREAGGWRFDSAGAKEEILDRNIGRDELHAIAALRELVDAQMEYRASEGGGAFAQHFLSSAGKRDGLFWPVPKNSDEKPSPLGPLAAVAGSLGYEDPEDRDRPPFYGYYFRMLYAQGPNAPGGAQEYLKDGRLTRGFAIMAYPAEYGRSGIKTFIVSHRGIIFENDLGPETAKRAEEMAAFDPGDDWTPALDPTLKQ